MAELFWNDLSVLNLEYSETLPFAKHSTDAQLQMERIVHMMRIWSQFGGSSALHVPSVITTLAPGYTLAKWRNDTSVNRDLRQLFRSFTSRKPNLADDLDHVSHGAEMHCRGRIALGLLAAWLLDGIAISWDSDESWNCSSVDCDLYEPGLTEVSRRKVGVPNASSLEHIHRWLGAKRSTREQYLTNGAVLLESTPEYLPSVRFVGPALSQLIDWAPNQDGWAFVLRAVCQLQDLCAHWGPHSFPHQEISSPCSPESTSVDENPKLRSCREFLCEDGELRYFTWHIKHYKLNLRIHYAPDATLKIVRVGYIGHHLPI